MRPRHRCGEYFIRKKMTLTLLNDHSEREKENAQRKNPAKAFYVKNWIFVRTNARYYLTGLWRVAQPVRACSISTIFWVEKTIYGFRVSFSALRVSNEFRTLASCRVWHVAEYVFRDCSREFLYERNGRIRRSRWFGPGNMNLLRSRMVILREIFFRYTYKFVLEQWLF